jgi:hypothetical protein
MVCILVYCIRVPESTPPIDWANTVDGNCYNRTAMMMSYDAGAGWWTFIISTPSNILGVRMSKFNSTIFRCKCCSR